MLRHSLSLLDYLIIGDSIACLITSSIHPLSKEVLLMLWYYLAIGYDIDFDKQIGNGSWRAALLIPLIK